MTVIRLAFWGKWALQSLCESVEMPFGLLLSSIWRHKIENDIKSNLSIISKGKHSFNFHFSGATCFSVVMSGQKTTWFSYLAFIYPGTVDLANLLFLTDAMLYTQNVCSHLRASSAFLTPPEQLCLSWFSLHAPWWSWGTGNSFSLLPDTHFQRLKCLLILLE